MKRNIILFVLLVALLAVYATIPYLRTRGLTDSDWKQAKDSNTVAAYNDFLAKHPHGTHVAEAKAAVEELDWNAAKGKNSADAYNAYLKEYQQDLHSSEAAARLADLRDERDWATDKAANTLAAVDAYLKAHESSKHAVEARELREAIVDDDAWAEARSANSSASVQAYLARHPSGRHVAEAKAISESLAWNAVRATAAVGDLKQFLKQYPNGPHSAEVTSKLDALLEVFRFDKVEETEKDGNRFMTLLVLDPMTKYSIDIYVYQRSVPIPASDGRLALPPDERLMKVARGLKKGDLVDVHITGNDKLGEIERYTGNQDEDMPDSRLFVRLTSITVKNIEFPAVTLRKFRKERTYPIALMDGTGKWLPDQSLAKKLKVYKEGDIVEANIQAEEPNVLRMGMQYFVSDLIPYKLPQVGKIVAVQKRSEGKPAIVELLVEGKVDPDTYNYDSGATLNVGEKIWFRVTISDGKKYLQFIWWKVD